MAAVLMLHSAGAGAASAEPPPKKMGLLLALYNANVTTDWVKVVRMDRAICLPAVASPHV